MPAQKSPHLEWLQVLRGVAAIMVFLYHVGVWEYKTFGRLSIPPFLYAGEAGVDVFFVISGFIMVFITPHKLGKLSAWLEFLYRRFTRIFPPYWIIFVLMFVVWLRRPDLFNHYEHNQMDIPRSFLLLPQSFLPLIGVGWTLIHEVYFYVIISALLVCGIVGRCCWLGLWFLVVLLANVTGLEKNAEGHPFWQLIFSPFGLEFQMGALIALTYRRIASLSLSFYIWALLAMTSLMVIYIAGQFIPFVGVYPDNNYLFRVGYYGLAAFALVLCSVQLDVSSARLKAPTWAILLGDASFAFYLMHVPIMDAMYKLLKLITAHPGPWLQLFYVILIAATTLAGAIFFHKQIERRLMSFFHKMGASFFKECGREHPLNKNQP